MTIFPLFRGVVLAGLIFVLFFMLVEGPLNSFNWEETLACPVDGHVFFDYVYTCPVHGVENGRVIARRVWRNHWFAAECRFGPCKEMAECGVHNIASCR